MRVLGSLVTVTLIDGWTQVTGSVATGCNGQKVRYKVVPDLFEMSLSGVDVDEIAGIPLIGFRESTITGLNRVVKRGLDIVIASLVLLISLPLWTIAAIVIKLDSS